MSIIQNITSIILSSGIIGAIIIFTSRSLFNHLLNKDLAQFQTKFSIFHQKQAAVIAELYSHLANSKQLLVDLTFVVQTNPKPLSEKKTNTNFALTEFSTFYLKHKIYFNSELCNKIENVLKLMKEAFIEFYSYQDGETYDPKKNVGWKNSWEKVDNEIKPLTEELETEFRKIILP